MLKLNRTVLLTLLLLLTACVKVNSCPPIKEFTQEYRNALADELVAMQRKRVGSMRSLETQTAFTVFASGRASGLSDPIRHTVRVRRPSPFSAVHRLALTL